MLIFELIKSVIIGIIQGITEWLPVSSTGHMILADEFVKLSVSEEFKSMFMVVIQFGSILAVLCLFFHKLNPFSPKKNKEEKKSTIDLWLKVLVAVVPAAAIGLVFDDVIDALFFNPVTVAITLILYGVLFILLENRKQTPKIQTLNQLSYSTALKIGIFQVLALIPGTSRSGSTILGAVFLGTSREVAAEFSFFLAIPVMFGASLLKIVKMGFSCTSAELAILLTGTVVAFLVSLFAIKFLMDYVKKRNFKPFGYYRIVLGIIVLLYFFVIK